MDTRLTFGLQTGNVGLVMAVLKLLPGLRGETAYDDTMGVSTCQSFLRAIASDMQETWVAKFLEDSKENTPVECRETDDEIVFRHSSYCFTVFGLTKGKDDELAGWKMNFAMELGLLRLLLDVIESTLQQEDVDKKTLRTVLTQDKKKVSAADLRQAVTAS